MLNEVLGFVCMNSEEEACAESRMCPNCGAAPLERRGAQDGIEWRQCFRCLHVYVLPTERNMNIDTGEIRKLAPGEAPKDNEVQVDMEQATPKQRKELKVSPHDFRSVLGRQRHYAFMERNEKKRLRKKLKGHYGK